ncbi:immunity 49 family protein [Gloeobacter kilaueensis]|uniref:Uncharacterized protein n=1 Tax=Gloeobacter kilaueensis (strain ATCC BAA-2537 / CCAP 1431/1 / ULC 316 / JS1) TaxID=1183438 RepID=U5QFB0_GLOK1|nr:immunity 49 family protein [Gloeobacter kilaueensis]AGY56345.1 hypothetical protein GKIL_0098 [Gloeobacter kilaueensis JS1]
MAVIARNDLNIEFVRKQALRTKRLMESMLVSSKQNPNALETLLFSAQAYAGYTAVLEPESPEICAALRLGVQAAVALFVLATTAETELTVTLGDGPPVTLPTTGPNSYTDGGTWCLGFYLAVICRNLDALDTLCRIPLSVLRQSSTQVDEFFYSYICALQSYWQGKSKDAAQHLTAAIKTAKPDKIQCFDEDYLYLIGVSQIDVLYNLISKDQQGFDKALTKALEYHYKFWTTDDDGRLNATAFLAYNYLALAGLAYEQGMSVTVESDYLPLSLVRGKCAVSV